MKQKRSLFAFLGLILLLSIGLLIGIIRSDYPASSDLSVEIRNTSLETDEIQVAESEEVQRVVNLLRSSSETSPTQFGDDMRAGVITESDSYDKLIEAIAFMSIAIDSDRNLSALEEYGIYKSQTGGYTIDKVNYPGWMPLHRHLGGLMSRGSSQRILDQFSSLGMSQGNIDAIYDYISDSDVMHRMDFAQREHNAQIANLTNQGIPVEEIEERNKILIQGLSMEIEHIQKQWALEIYDLLDESGQNILDAWIRNRNVSTTTTMYPER